MENHAAAKVGIYVDLENLTRNGGRGMRYSALRDFAVRDGADPIRMNVYLAYDLTRAESDFRYRTNALEFHSVLRDSGFKVIQKAVKWYVDEDTGQKNSKANVDLDRAVDALLQSERLDRVLLATGDGDFVQVGGCPGFS